MLEGCHKIGFSNDPFRRLNSFSVPGARLEVVHKIVAGDPRLLESALHTAFDAVRANGEWFRLGRDDLADLATIHQVHHVDDLPARFKAHFESAQRSMRRGGPNAGATGDYADKLGEFMAADGVSQSELSRRSGVPQTTISHYLRRTSRPSWAHIQSLSKALGVSCDALADDPPEPVAPRIIPSKRK